MKRIIKRKDYNLSPEIWVLLIFLVLIAYLIERLSGEWVWFRLSYVLIGIIVIYLIVIFFSEIFRDVFQGVD